MSAKPSSKSARLQDLIHRRDRVLAILHPPTAAHARIMESAACEALFVGTGGGGGASTRPAEIGTPAMTQCVTIARRSPPNVSTPAIIAPTTPPSGPMAGGPHG